MMALAAGLPTSFRDREELRPEGETSLEMRQVLAAPTLLGGPLRITEGGRYA
jgi:hypothetical protein